MERETIEISIDKETKNKAEAIFKKLGMTTDMALQIFFSKVIIENGLPFSVRIGGEKREESGRDRPRGGDRRDGGRDRRFGGGFGGGDRDRRGGGSRGGFGGRDRRSGGDDRFKRSDDFKSSDKPRVKRDKLTLKK